MKHRLLRIALLIAVVAVAALAIASAAGANGNPPVFVSTTTAGQTEDGLIYGREDVIAYLPYEEEWVMVFDGSEHGLKSKMNNINSIAWSYFAGESLLMTFTGSPAYVPGITGKVFPQDVVRFSYPPSRGFDGGTFGLVIDGSDVGLNLVSEGIDGLSWFPSAMIEHVDDASYFGSECYSPNGVFAISFAGPYVVPAAGGGWLKGSGSDVVFFCPSELGDHTVGSWYDGFDSFRGGVTPRQAINSISMIDLLDGVDYIRMVFLFTVKRPFSAPTISGVPSEGMYASYDSGSGASMYGTEGNFNTSYPRLNGVVDAIEWLTAVGQ